MSSCPFCSIEPLRERLILETKTLLLVSDNYPVVDYHMLILSKEHILSFGYAKDEQKIEIRQLADRLAFIFSKLNKANLVFFEHGNMSENISSYPSIDHAHIHVIPTNKQLECFFPAESFYIDFNDLGGLIKEMSYYFFWEIFSGKSFAGPDYKIESQFIRKIVKGQPNNWNWRTVKDYQSGRNENIRRLRGLVR